MHRKCYFHTYPLTHCALVITYRFINLDQLSDGSLLNIPSHYLIQCWHVINKLYMNVSKIECAAAYGNTLQWRHNGHDSISNHQPQDCLLNRLFRRRSMKTSKLRVTSLCAGNSPGTSEFPGQMASNTENVSIWWCHHEISLYPQRGTRNPKQSFQKRAKICRNSNI